jgi:hypothetical protein
MKEVRPPEHTIVTSKQPHLHPFASTIYKRISVQSSQNCSAVSEYQLLSRSRATIAKPRDHCDARRRQRPQPRPSAFLHNHHTLTMSNPLDTDAGSELFSSYEAELKLVQADLNQKLDQIPDLSGEPRKAAISQAERALEEASELVGSISPVLGDGIDVCFSSIKCALRSRISPLHPAPK